jgi:hypothetical protein
MMMFGFIFFVLFILDITAWRTKNHVKSADSFVYVNRFGCIPYEARNDYYGRYTKMVVHVNHNYYNISSLYIAGYSTTKESAYSSKILTSKASKISCQERIEQADYLVNMRGDDPDTKYLQDSKYLYRNKFSVVLTKDILKYQKPAFFFWAVINCDTTCSNSDGMCQGPIDIELDGHFVNILEPDYTDGSQGLATIGSEVSFEYAGMKLTAIVFFVVQNFVIIYMIIVRKILISKHRDHHTVKILLVITITEWFRYLFASIYFFKYDKTGIQEPGYLITSQVFYIISDVLLILLLGLLAHGWTIVRRKIKMIGRIRGTFFVIAYLCFSLSALVLSEMAESGSSVCYYETSPGYLMLAILGIAGLRILTISNSTLKSFNSIQNIKFFYLLRALCVVYIWYAPFWAIVLIKLSALYKRKIFVIFSCIVALITQLTLITLYYPRISSEFFPFHNKVDDMRLYKLKKNDENNKANNIDEIQENKPISFTGGYGNNIIQEDGRVKPESKFDQQQLGRLKALCYSVDSCINQLQIYSSKLKLTMDNIAVDLISSDLVPNNQSKNWNYKKFNIDSDSDEDNDQRHSNKKHNNDVNIRAKSTPIRGNLEMSSNNASFNRPTMPKTASPYSSIAVLDKGKFIPMDSKNDSSNNSKSNMSNDDED